MKILFCAYDRTGHITTGPNAWIQRLIPDLINQYHLDVTTLFFHDGEEPLCPTLTYFEQNKLPYFAVNMQKKPYVEDQVKEIIQIVKTHNITVVVANLVIPGYYVAKYLNPFNIPVIPVFHSNETFTKGVINKFMNSDKDLRISKSVSVSMYINSLINSNNRDNHIVIPCGTPTSEYRAKQVSGTLKIIYAGRLVIEAKQILKLTHAFCEAANANNNLVFTIIGNGDQSIEVQNIIKNYNSSKVQLLNALPPSEIIEKISEHQVFTLLSDYEGMPIAMMEAMACGVVPVCYIGEGGINEIIEDGVNGFIVTDRTTDYQNKLKILQENPDLWRKMSQNAIKTIEAKYSTKINHHKWADLLLSFKNISIGNVIIPDKIELDAELLYFGDFRRPPFFKHLFIQINNVWMQIRIKIRPRARLKTLLKKFSPSKKFPNCILSIGKNCQFGQNFQFDSNHSEAMLTIGENTLFRRNNNIILRNKANLTIGENCFFNTNTSISCLQTITIGNHVICGEGVKFYDHNHKYSDKNKMISEQGYSLGEINIGDNVWIGSNVIILKGVTIGNNVVIGANIIVHKSIPDNTLVYLNQDIITKEI